MNTMSVEPTSNLSPISINKLAQKPRRSSRNVAKFNKIELYSNLNRNKKKIVKEPSFYSYSAIDKKSVTPAPVEEFSEHSTLSEKLSSESSFEFGILGKALNCPHATLRSTFLDKISKNKLNKEQEYLPQVRPITPGIINPLRTSRKHIKGKFIKLKVPPQKMIDFYGATSKRIS